MHKEILVTIFMDRVYLSQGCRDSRDYEETGSLLTATKTSDISYTHLVNQRSMK